MLVNEFEFDEREDMKHFSVSILIANVIKIIIPLPYVLSFIYLLFLITRSESHYKH